eukprot:TRINITY_DN3806_c0_g2_i3.p2 TRINITY_DN3806_c0_g2~~TRINITY_DN3806_c0_g2_i3.p2  ORF type:complete len:211 (+),score=47.69 TRINITY_DN3806_c0_g2_i3:1114-1746(+)
MKSLIEPVMEKYLREVGTIARGSAMVVTEHVAEYLIRMLEFHVSTILSAKCVDSLVATFTDVLINGSDPATSKAILMFFEYVINVKVEDYKERIDSWTSPIMLATIQLISGVITGMLTEASIVISSAYARNQETAKVALCSGLMQPRFACVPENVKTVVVKFVGRFYRAFAKIKPVVAELNKLVNGQSTVDAFIAFELQIAQAAGKSNTI